MPKGGTIKPGLRDFAVGDPYQRHFDGTTVGLSADKLWKPKTKVGDGPGMFLYNARPGHELTEDQLAHNFEIMRKINEAASNGIEK